MTRPLKQQRGGKRVPSRLIPGDYQGPLLVGAVGAMVVLLATTLGAPGVTPDSVTYLAAARGLLDGSGSIGVDGRPYVEFPPLYPTLIAAATLGVLSPGQAARVIDALAFGVTVAATGLLVQQGTGSRRLALLGAAAALVMPPLVTVVLHIWSEPLFIAWVMLGLLAAHRYAAAPSLTTLVLLAAAAALAALTRYIGVTVVVTALLIVLGTRGSPLGRRAVHVGALALIALAPLAAWVLRNEAVTGTLAGERYPSATSLRDAVYATADLTTGWFLPTVLPVAVRLAVLAGAAVIGLVIVTGLLARNGRTRAFAVAVPVAVFIAVYSITLIGAAVRVAADPIDDRLLSPLAAPLIALVLVGAHAAGAWDGSTRTRVPMRAAAALVAGVWLVASAAASVQIVGRHLRDGAGGYESARWRQSELIRALREDALPGPLYSNDPFAIWYRTGRQAALAPRRHAYASPQSSVADRERLAAAVAGSPAYLVWFDGVPRDFLLRPDELAASVALAPLVSVSDGTVYRITERNDR